MIDRGVRLYNTRLVSNKETKAVPRPAHCIALEVSARRRGRERLYCTSLRPDDCVHLAALCSCYVYLYAPLRIPVSDATKMRIVSSTRQKERRLSQRTWKIFRRELQAHRPLQSRAGLPHPPGSQTTVPDSVLSSIVCHVCGTSVSCFRPFCELPSIIRQHLFVLTACSPEPTTRKRSRLY